MTDFKWRHFQGDVILWAVRWYCRYPISYRDLEEMLAERGISVDHTTIYRWVQCYAPEMEKRLRWFWRRGFDPSWRLDETYVKVRGKWNKNHRTLRLPLAPRRGHNPRLQQRSSLACLFCKRVLRGSSASYSGGPSVSPIDQVSLGTYHKITTLTLILWSLPACPRPDRRLGHRLQHGKTPLGPRLPDPVGFAANMNPAIARPAARDESSARRAIAQPAPTGVNTNPAQVAAG